MLDHAENIGPFELMKDTPRTDGFEEIVKLCQYWKSWLRVTCINM